MSDAATLDVTVVIATYNACDLLAGCLESIFAAPARCSFEVVVADDASSDGSAAMVRERFPQVRLQANRSNLGYATCNNRAIAASSARYVFLLNSDTVVLPGLLDTLVDFLDAHPEAGAAGSLLYNEDGTVQASAKALPSIRSAFVGKRSWLYRLFPGSAALRRELLHWQPGRPEEPYPAGYVSSAAIMIPREVAREVGELDRRLWHFIDADYCKRIRDTGREIYYVPRAGAVHLDHQGGTMAGWRKRFRSLWTFHNGAWIYFRKHSGRPLLHPATIAVGLALGVRFAACLPLQAAKEVLRLEQRYDRWRRRPGTSPAPPAGGRPAADRVAHSG